MSYLSPNRIPLLTISAMKSTGIEPVASQLDNFLSDVRQPPRIYVISFIPCVTCSSMLV